MKLKELDKMANLTFKNTGVDQIIWIRPNMSKNKHQAPILKIQQNSGIIPVSISENPEVLIDRKIKHF